MSTVIKQGEQGKVMHRLVTFDLADHMAEARQIVDAARTRADRLLAEARHEAERLKQEAGRRGHEEGYAKGLAEGLAAGQAQGLAEATERFKQEHAAAAAAMTAAVQAIEQQKRDLLIAANRDVLELCVMLARKVTGRVAELDSQAAVDNLERALRLVGNRTDLVVRVAPQDAVTVQRFAEQLADEVANARHVQLVEDATVTPGGVVVTSGGLEIDATIDTQLEQITGLLLGQDAAGNWAAKQARAESTGSADGDTAGAE